VTNTSEVRSGRSRRACAHRFAEASARNRRVEDVCGGQSVDEAVVVEPVPMPMTQSRVSFGNVDGAASAATFNVLFHRAENLVDAMGPPF
jgi:hypothetical protein